MGTSHNQLIEHILDHLESRAPIVARSMAEATRTEVAAYRAIRDPGLTAELLAHAEDHVHAFVRCARTRRPPSGPELDFVRERGATRARELVPLESLLEAYLVGQRMTWEAIVEEAGMTPEGLEAAQELTRVTFAYTHAINTAVAQAYVQTRQQVSADADRMKRDVLDRLLSGGGPGPGAESIGLEPGAAHAVVVGRLVGERGNLRLVADAVAHAAGAGVSAFVVPRHDEVVAVLPLDARRGPRELAAALVRAAAGLLRTRGAALRAGVSTACTELGDVARAYGEAQRALRHVSALRPAVALEEVRLVEYLTGATDGAARRLIAPAVRAIAEARPALAETVLAYADADLNVARTAQRLTLHPNTVHYRLRRVEELTGLDPRRFADLMELVTAVRLVEAERRRG